MSSEEPKKRVYTRARDKSLQAYKDWLLGTVMAMTGKTREEADSMTEEEWEAGWREFWGDKLEE